MDGLQHLGEWVASLAQTPYGTLALAAVTFAEASFLPVAPDILLIPLCIVNPANAFFYAAICSVSSALGAVFGYTVGKSGGRPILRRVVSEKRVRTIERYYQRYGVWPIAIAGFIPLPYKVFTLSAGTFLLNIRHFLLASFTGRTLRFFILSAVIYYYDQPLVIWLRQNGNILLTALAVMIVAGVLLYQYRWRKNMTPAESPIVNGEK